jgi:hypothetical protein
MGITQVVSLRSDAVHLWELTAHIVHAGTPHSVERNAVLFILAVNLRGLITARGGSLGQDCQSRAAGETFGRRCRRTD